MLDLYGTKVVFPFQLRTKSRFNQYGLWGDVSGLGKLNIADAPGYLAFLQILKNSEIVFTDSGGIQKEACILNVPCITLRENTERPNTVEVGANRIVGDELRSTL